MADSFLFLGVDQLNEGLAFGMGDGSDLTGSDMKDLSGNARDGTITGSPVVIDNGAWSKARTFDGTDDEISAGDVLDMGTGDFSVSVWVKTTTSTLGYIVSKRDTATSTNDGWAIRVNADGTVSGEHCDGSAGVLVATTTVTVNDGSWHHVVANWDRDWNLTIHVDGRTADATTDISAQAADNSNAINLYIGREGNATTPQRISADLDEVYIFTRLLTGAEIDAVFRAPRTRLTSPDGATKIPLIDTRTTIDVTREVLITPFSKLGTADAGGVTDVDLRQIKRTISIQAKAVPYGELIGPEVLSEIERLLLQYQDSTGQARLTFEWGHKNSEGDWKTYKVHSSKITGLKDNEAMGGSDRVFDFQIVLVEGGTVLSTIG